MKKILIAVLVANLVAATMQAEEPQPPQITVFGTATTEVQPDEMVWSLDVTTKLPGLEETAAAHSKLVARTLAYLKEMAIEQKKLQTSRMEFGENLEYRSSSMVKVGYIAQTSISFTLADLEQYQKLWLGLAKLDGVSVRPVHYGHTRRIGYRNETRQKALLAAREKAQAMAETLNSQLGEPLLIAEEDQSYNESWEMNRAENALNNSRTMVPPGEASHEGVSLGTIPIKARVKVSFRLLPVKK